MPCENINLTLCIDYGGNVTLALHFAKTNYYWKEPSEIGYSERNLTPKPNFVSKTETKVHQIFMFPKKNEVI